MDFTLLSITQPDFSMSEWEKWRLTYNGGRPFIDRYLERSSTRETLDEFTERKRQTYCPAFASNAVDDIRNSIYRHFKYINRVGGSESYQERMGKNVDRHGTTMNSFMGEQVLTELLVMAKVGIYIDMPEIAEGSTLLDTYGKVPYLYFYRREDILGWEYDYSFIEPKLKRLILRDNQYSKSETTGLYEVLESTFRELNLVDNQVEVTFYHKDGKTVDRRITLNIPEIPFVFLEIPKCLLVNTADYQIALLNLESTDNFYVRKSNFPIYTEQYNPAIDGVYQKTPSSEYVDEDGNVVVPNNTSGAMTVELGATTGRRYPINTDRPDFINPSPEPIRASMEKCTKLKEDIRILTKLVVENYTSDTKEPKQNNDHYESGLSYIGAILCRAENKVAYFWNMYEGGRDVAEVTYPYNYSQQTDDQRFSRIEKLQSSLQKIPSQTFKKELSKQIVYEMLNGQISDSKIKIIFAEIDSAEVMTTDAATIIADLEAGLVDPETASLARGYPKGTVEKAEKAHAERLARIAESQGGELNQARGNPDGELTLKTSSQEKVGKAQRGEAEL